MNYQPVVKEKLLANQVPEVADKKGLSEPKRGPFSD